MGSTTAEWRGSVAQKRGTFAGSCAGYSERGSATRNNRIPGPNVVTRLVSVKRTDGRGSPSKESMSQQQQQLGGSGGTFPAEYAARAVTARSLHQDGHAGHCASA